MQLRRLDSVTRSPIYSHFGETLEGVVTIRAFGAQPRFAALNLRVLHANQLVSFSALDAGQWLSFRLQCIGLVVVAFVCFFSVVQSHLSTINSSLVRARGLPRLDGRAPDPFCRSACAVLSLFVYVRCAGWSRTCVRPAHHRHALWTHFVLYANGAGDCVG